MRLQKKWCLIALKGLDEMKSIKTETINGGIESMVITLNKIKFSRDELKDIEGCLVCGVIDSVDDGGEKFVQLSFCNPESKKVAQLRVYEDGTMCTGSSVAENEGE